MKSVTYNSIPWNNLEQSKQFKVWTSIVEIKSCFAIILLPI